MIGEVDEGDYASTQHYQNGDVEQQQNARSVERSQFELEEFDVVGHGDEGGAA